MPLGGVDAQALEHGMTQLEDEKKKLQEMYEDLVFKVQLSRVEHPAGCVETGMMMKAEVRRLNRQIEEMEKWCCSACGLFVANDPRFNKAFSEMRKCAMCQKGEALGSGLCKACADTVSCSHDPRTCKRCKQMADERANFGA